MKRKEYIFAALATAVTIFIFFNSSRTAVESSESSSFFSNWIMMHFPFENADKVVYFVRKTAHMTEFFAQSLMISLHYICKRVKFPKKAVNVLFLGLLTACTDELIQHFVEGRADLVTDVWIDFCGAGLAVCVGFIIYKFARNVGDGK